MDNLSSPLGYGRRSATGTKSLRNPKLGCALLACLLVGGCWILGPGYKWKTRSFLKQVSESTDPESLRQWAIQLLDSSTDSYQVLYVWGAGPPLPDSTSAKVDSSSLFPTELLKHPHGPNDAYAIRRGSPANDHVQVTWGGGFGHWGLKIGRLEYVPDNGDYCLKWVDGIYVWHDLQ